jgi:peptidoglycan/LPS O-acetylase OafA/YrhL
MTLVPAFALVCALAPTVSETVKPFYDIVIILGVLPAIVYAGAAWDVPPSGKWPATFLGDVSYPVYVIHYPIVGMAWVVLRRFVSPTVYLAGVAIFIIGLAWILARAVDEPLRAKVSRVLRLRRSGLRHTQP